MNKRGSYKDRCCEFWLSFHIVCTLLVNIGSLDKDMEAHSNWTLGIPVWKRQPVHDSIIPATCPAATLSRVVAIDNPRQCIYKIIILLPCYGCSAVSSGLQARRLALDRQGGKGIWRGRDHSREGMGA